MANRYRLEHLVASHNFRSNRHPASSHRPAFNRHLAETVVPVARRQARHRKLTCRLR